MKHFRAILIGSMVWSFILITFVVLGFVPTIKDSLNLQALVVGVLIVPYAVFGASIFYKNGNKENGMTVGVIMSQKCTALLTQNINQFASTHFTLNFIDIAQCLVK